MTELREQARRVIAALGERRRPTTWCCSSARAPPRRSTSWSGCSGSSARARSAARAARRRRPVVLVGPYEHHSNELPWLESVAEVVEVALAGDGAHRPRRPGAASSSASPTGPLKIGAFSAASNVTGILTDVPAVARLLHRARRAGGVRLRRRRALRAHRHAPGRRPTRASTPSCCRPHKFVGGPQASGVLVLHRALFRTRRARAPGRRHRRLRGRDRSRPPSTTPAASRSARRAAPPPSSATSAPASPSWSRRWPGPSASWRTRPRWPARALARLARHPRIQLLGPRTCPGWRSSRSTSRGCTTTWCRCCSTTCSASRTAPAAPAPVPTGTACWASTARAPSATAGEIARGNLGVKPGWVRLTLPFYASEEDVDVHPRARSSSSPTTARPSCPPTACPGTTASGATSRRRCRRAAAGADRGGAGRGHLQRPATAGRRPPLDRAAAAGRARPLLARGPAPPPRRCARAPRPRPRSGTPAPAGPISTSCSGSATSTPTGPPTAERETLHHRPPGLSLVPVIAISRQKYEHRFRTRGLRRR